MNPFEIIKRKSFRLCKPEITLTKLDPSQSDSSDDDLSSVMVHSEIICPNPIRRSCAMKAIVFSGSPSHKLPLSPNAPFGPKAKAFIIPNKDLSDRSQVLDMDELENYKVWSEIGKGSYAVVKLATHRATMEKCAIKVYSNKSLEDSALKENVLREIKILQLISHQKIVKFHEQLQGSNNLYIVMEYVRGIGLTNHLVARNMKRLQEPEACTIFSQVVSALKYCHERNIVHRDIKLENIQLDLHCNVKLIDFGFATCMPSNKKSLIFCGSPSYMAPEIINKTEYLGPPVDIWACGIVLFLLVTGEFPFKGNTEKRVFDRIKKGKFDIPNYVSRLCTDLILRILNPVPGERLSAAQVLDHAWVKSCAGAGVYATPACGDNIEVTDE